MLSPSAWIRRPLFALSLVAVAAPACTSRDATDADETGTEESGEEETTESSTDTTAETTDTTAETTDTGGDTEVCNNNMDDDGDELVDCADDDCADDPACGVPPGWMCDPMYYDEDEDALPPGAISCDCECGVPDPDCEQNPDNGAYNCPPGNTCSPEGTCVAPPPEICGNGEDEDLDGATDCEDTDCLGEEGCAPEGWTCAPSAYDQEGDEEVCDCECGVLDPDCEVADVAQNDCVQGEQCNTTTLTCDLITGENCGNNQDSDNDGLAGCDDQECWGVGDCVHPDWICNPSLYASGGQDASCDCNCGTYDPDCDDADAPVYGCTLGDLSACSPEGTCTIAGWNCNPNFFGTMDGCDCGCGVVDPDCASSSVGDCEFCGWEGGCGPQGAACPSNIDPEDNSSCAAP